MSSSEPSLDLIWRTFTAYQRTAVMKAAIELDVFTAVAAGADTLPGLAARCKAAPRGLRPLLDHLVTDGFLTREDDRWKLTPTAATFLDRGSPLYLGSAITFIASPHVVSGFTHLTEAVRRGGTAAPDAGSLMPDHPMWVEFARGMAPIAGMCAELLATLLDVERAPGWQVLDLAAGHGLFGITLARRNPRVEVTAVDWASVLAVAEENARAAGVAERFRKLPGSVFDVPFGGPYDRVLVPNLLHHFDRATCERLLAKVREGLAPGGRVVIVEFVPDDDRQGPPDAVRFGLVMLAGTPAGDAYTFAEYRAMLERAGFRGATLHDVRRAADAGAGRPRRALSGRCRQRRTRHTSAGVHTTAGSRAPGLRRSHKGVTTLRSPRAGKRPAFRCRPSANRDAIDVAARARASCRGAAPLLSWSAEHAQPVCRPIA